jgi:hypothetical protein
VPSRPGGSVYFGHTSYQLSAEVTKTERSATAMHEANANIRQRVIELLKQNCNKKAHR